MTFLFIMLNMLIMKTTLIRNIPEDLWHQFKILCAHQDISMNQKVLDLVREAVEADDEHRQLQQAFSKGMKRAAAKK